MRSRIFCAYEIRLHATSALVEAVPCVIWVRNTLLMYFFCNQVIMQIARVTANGCGMTVYVWSVVAACWVCLLLVAPVEVTKRWLFWMVGRCRLKR